ncbi:MAG: YitT family protein [Clostridia bacterium]|nr:YitT family protein [Clostridia bacterium]
MLGAYTGQAKSMLLCAVGTRHEISLVKHIVKEIDKNAFILIGDMTEVLGEGFERE